MGHPLANKMAKKDFLPRDQDERDTFLDRWLANIPSVLTSLSLPATYADAVKTKVTAQRTSFADWKNEKALAASKSDAYQLANTSMENDLRVFNQNLKTTTGYTTTIGDTIGIE